MTKIRASSGNVYEDLGYKNPEEAKAKAVLAQNISVIISERGLTQSEAATILNIDQPKVSNLIRGKLRDFSLERLIRFTITLGNDVRIVVSERHNANKKGRLEVAAA
jgi:predicted XRE-type DNA-binding protein